MSSVHRFIAILFVLFLPAGALADQENEDDKKDRRSTATVVLNLTEEVGEPETPILREALLAMDGVLRVHVCAHTQTVTIEFEENRSRCTRRILDVVSEAGFQAMLRDRVLVPSREATYRTSAPAMNTTARVSPRPQIIQAKRNY